MELVPQLRDLPLKSAARKIRESCCPQLPSFEHLPNTLNVSFVSKVGAETLAPANKNDVTSFHRYQREYQKRNQRRRLQQYHRVEHTILDSPIWPFTLGRNREVSCISTRPPDCCYSLRLLSAFPLAGDSSSIPR